MTITQFQDLNFSSLDCVGLTSVKLSLGEFRSLTEVYLTKLS